MLYVAGGHGGPYILAGNGLVLMEWDRAKLKQICRDKQRRMPGKLLGADVKRFMKRVVGPRQRKLAMLAEAWVALLPEELVEHSCLDKFNRGSLQVLVDSGVHLAELDLLVREGLADGIRQMCPSVPLSRIKLVRGCWYRTDEEGNKIPGYS